RAPDPLTYLNRHAAGYTAGRMAAATPEAACAGDPPGASSIGKKTPAKTTNCRFCRRQDMLDWVAKEEMERSGFVFGKSG
ncbi:MAG: hypothetical protein OXK78_11530, partial [Caldilineaceae bacterium]|nr:hypothetical protein [Caldilineaceae bacterium]